MQTVYQKITQLFDKDESFSFYVSEYLENRKKYLEALMTQSEVSIGETVHNFGLTREEIEATVKNLFPVINYFREKMKAAEDAWKGILESHVPLSGIQNIQGYEGFDKLSIEIDEKKRFVIHYKPRSVAVSFWSVDTNNVYFFE